MPTRWRAASRSSATTAPLPRPGRHGRQGLSQPRDDVWLWGGTLGRHPADHHATASAPAIRTRTCRRCRAFGRDAILKPDADRRPDRVRRGALAPASDGCRGGGSRGPVFAGQLRASVTATERQGQPELGAPEPRPTDDLALRRRPRRRSTTRSGTATAASCRPGATGSTPRRSRRWRSTSTSTAAAASRREARGGSRA